MTKEAVRIAVYSLRCTYYSDFPNTVVKNRCKPSITVVGTFTATGWLPGDQKYYYHAAWRVGFSLKYQSRWWWECATHNLIGVKSKVWKVKVKFTLQHAMRYSPTLSLTSAQDAGGCSTLRPGRFAPCKETQYPWHRKVVGPQGRSWRTREVSSSPGFEPWNAQAVESRYTDRAIPVR
jgi:hypothetical protein